MLPSISTKIPVFALQNSAFLNSEVVAHFGKARILWPALSRSRNAHDRGKMSHCAELRYRLERNSVTTKLVFETLEIACNTMTSQPTGLKKQNQFPSGFLKPFSVREPKKRSNREPMNGRGVFVHVINGKKLIFSQGFSGWLDHDVRKLAHLAISSPGLFGIKHNQRNLRAGTLLAVPEATCLILLSFE